MKKISSAIDTPLFLKFVNQYLQLFIAERQNKKGRSRWLYEYEEMTKQGLFKPTIIRALYKKILTDTFYLGYIQKQAIFYIGLSAQEATEAYLEMQDKYLYKICIITGEIATDDDDDEYINLDYTEALEICKALNEEAEEELFILKRM